MHVNARRTKAWRNDSHKYDVGLFQETTKDKGRGLLYHALLELLLPSVRSAANTDEIRPTVHDINTDAERGQALLREISSKILVPN